MASRMVLQRAIEMEIMKAWLMVLQKAIEMETLRASLMAC